MNHKYLYPAVFIPLDDGAYGVKFPDFAACITQGDSFENAIYMAKDALSAMLTAMEDDKDEIPKASIPYSKEGAIISFLEVDTLEYRRVAIMPKRYMS